MNVTHARRLAAVKERIREEPRRFDMNRWVRRSPLAPCGTAACIAGHVVWRAVRSAEKFRALAPSVAPRAAMLLGFSWQWIEGRSFQRDEDIFYPREWPVGLKNELYATRIGSTEHAEVACRAIDRFLAERGFGPDGERLSAEGGAS